MESDTTRFGNSSRNASLITGENNAAPDATTARLDVSVRED